MAPWYVALKILTQDKLLFMNITLTEHNHTNIHNMDCIISGYHSCYYFYQHHHAYTVVRSHIQ